MVTLQYTVIHLVGSLVVLSGASKNSRKWKIRNQDSVVLCAWCGLNRMPVHNCEGGLPLLWPDWPVIWLSYDQGYQYKNNVHYRYCVCKYMPCTLYMYTTHLHSFILLANDGNVAGHFRLLTLVEREDNNIWLYFNVSVSHHHQGMTIQWWRRI